MFQIGFDSMNASLMIFSTKSNFSWDFNDIVIKLENESFNSLT